MGRASRAKLERREWKRERPNLEEKLAQQLKLIQDLGHLYDSGNEFVALSLATCLRVLLHDTASSHSLLAQLRKLDSLKFVDTAYHRNPANLIRSHEGLVAMAVIEGKEGSWYVPNLKNNETERNFPLERFASWWKLMVLQDWVGHSWTRQSLVLEIANKEGGSHVDPNQSEGMRAVELENSMGWIVHDSRGEHSFENKPFFPSIRQIAWEVQLTLERRNPCEQ